MATARFILANLAENATLLNGTGGAPTPPVRSEVSPFTMERALNSERRSLWKAGAQNSVGSPGWQLDLDLGAAASINAAAVHGIRCPGGVINAIAAGYLDTYPSLTYVYIGGMVLNGRDAHITFSTFSKRYWSFFIDATAAPIIGRVKLGTILDIGLAPNPGSESSPFRNRVETQLEDGSISLNELGDPGHDFSLAFDPVTPIYRDRLESLHAHPGTLTYIDPRNRCFETFLRQGRVGSTSNGENAAGNRVEMGRCP